MTDSTPNSAQANRFTCQKCGGGFTVSAANLNKFPGWTPKMCMPCKGFKSGASAREEDLTTEQVLAKYTGGPLTGVFTDGAAEPNPGPGGWGAVYVIDNKIIAERHGSEPHTTNNRMELVALVAACELAPSGVPTTIYSDSKLCVDTLNQWAHKWKLDGWKRGKNGEIKNVELVQELHGIFEARPELKLEWIKAHAGNRWNEYADSLATAWRHS